MSSEEPTVSSTAPVMSMRWRTRSTSSWNRRNNVQPAIRASGMFTKKIQRQSRTSTNTPPRVGPTTAEMAQTLAM